jgi:unconventional prefoldin RPB5 interactor 1
MQEQKSSAATLIEQSSEIASSFDQLIDRELIKFDSVIPKIEELKSEYLPLKIKDISDTDGYAEVANALRFIVSKRTAIEDKRKELKADSLKFGKAVDNKAKEYTAMLEPIETHLRSEKATIDEERERIKKQKEEEEKKRIQARQYTLVQLGMTLNPFTECYTFFYYDEGGAQEETLHTMNIELYDESEWMNFVERMKELAKKKSAWDERLKAEKLLEEQKQEEERQRLKAEADRLQEEKKKQEDEARALEVERNALILERTGARYDQLHTMGLIASIKDNGAHGFVHFDRTFSVIVEDEFIKKSSAYEWRIALPNILEKLSLFKQEDEEKRKAKQKEEDDRLEKIRQDALAKAEADLQAKKDEDARMEKERIEQMTDKEKISHYINMVNSVQKPVLKTAKWNKAFSQFAFYLNALAEYK